MAREQQPIDSRTVVRNRLMALGIFLIPVLVLSAATGLWFAVKSGKIDIIGNLGTSNKGVLVEPVRDIGSVEILAPDGQVFDYHLLSPAQWTLLIPGGGDCAEPCKETLWLTRQLHVALGRRASHVRRIYLSESWPLEPEFVSYLQAEHPRMQLLHASPAAVDKLLGSLPGGRHPVRDDLFYLVDKRGFVMMVYGPEHSGKDVITDLKFLMKQVGDD